MTNVEGRMTKEAAKTVANATLIGRNRAAKLRLTRSALLRAGSAAATRLRPIVPEDYSERVREQAAWQAATSHAS